MPVPNAGLRIPLPQHCNGSRYTRRWKRPSSKPATIPTGSPSTKPVKHSSRGPTPGAIPRSVPDRVVTLTGLRPPGGRGRGRHRPCFSKTPARSRRRPPIRRPRRATSLWSRSDAEPMALRMWPSAEAVHACSFWIPATPDRRRPADRRRHSSIAIRLPCATPGRGPAFGPARTALVRLHPDHRYSRGPFHETVH